MKTQNNERGQAIVIIAFAFIVLLAFAALAIDGGMVYSDRRRAQNATDAGSLAGGGAAALSLANDHVMIGDFECGSAEVNAASAEAENAAQNLLQANKYNAAAYSVQVVCEDEDPTYFQDDLYLDVITNIITQTKTSFIHVVWDGIVQNNVQATTRVRAKTPFAYGQAVVGLNDEQDCNNASAGGVKFTGTGDVIIKGGGVWANGCIAAKGDCSVEVIGGGISSGNGNFGTCPTMDPLPVQENDVLPEDAYYVPTPDCDASGAVRISKLKLTNKSYVDLNVDYPGISLICLTDSGNALEMTGGTLRGDGYTIYTENSGDISINGGTVNLSAPGDPDTEPGLPGVLFYVEPDPSGTLSDVTINGNGSSTLKGLIYAPTADVTMSGTSGTATCDPTDPAETEDCDGPVYNTQIVAWNVEVSGGATIDINYNDTWTYPPQAKINLEK